LPDDEFAVEPRMAFRGKRVFSKPDWLRNTIPSSLLSTTITQHEVTQISRSGSLQQVPQSSRAPKVVANP
jgi:hypothetical protein